MRVPVSPEDLPERMRGSWHVDAHRGPLPVMLSPHALVSTVFALDLTSLEPGQSIRTAFGRFDTEEVREAPGVSSVTLRTSAPGLVALFNLTAIESSSGSRSVVLYNSVEPRSWVGRLYFRAIEPFHHVAMEVALRRLGRSRATRRRRLDGFDLLARLMDLVDFPALHAGWYRVLGGRLGGRNTLLLISIGRRTGLPRTTPLLFVREGADYVIIASNGGDEPYPGWWYNLRANPEVEIQVGRRRIACRAIETDETERKRLAAKLDAIYGGYETYRRKTRRDLTIFRLQPRLDPGLEPGP